MWRDVRCLARTVRHLEALSRRTGAQPGRLRMPARRNSRRRGRERLGQEHAPRHRRRCGLRGRRPGDDHGPAACHRRSAAGAPARLGRRLSRRLAGARADRGGEPPPRGRGWHHDYRWKAGVGRKAACCLRSPYFARYPGRTFERGAAPVPRDRQGIGCEPEGPPPR